MTNLPADPNVSLDDATKEELQSLLLTTVRSWDATQARPGRAVPCRAVLLWRGGHSPCCLLLTPLPSFPLFCSQEALDWADEEIQEREAALGDAAELTAALQERVADLEEVRWARGRGGRGRGGCFFPLATLGVSRKWLKRDFFPLCCHPGVCAGSGLQDV